MAAKNPTPVNPNFLTPPVAIIIGSILISISILISGGVIKAKSNTTNTQPNQPTVTTNTNPTIPAQKEVTLAQVKDAFGKSLLKFGDTNQKVVFVEVADPSCPYCQIAAGKNFDLNKQAGSQFTLVSDGGTYVAPVPEMTKLVKAGKAAFAYIYYPGHGNGEMGTKALYCAYENNKFWEVNDLLNSSQGYDLLNNKVKNDKSKSGDLADFLSSAIDPSTMKQCLDSGKYDKQLQADMALASSLGVNGTPGFFVNATKYAGAYSYKEMESTVNSYLQ